jgi:hypothetical protein
MSLAPAPLADKTIKFWTWTITTEQQQQQQQQQQPEEEEEDHTEQPAKKRKKQEATAQPGNFVSADPLVVLGLGTWCGLIWWLVVGVGRKEDHTEQPAGPALNARNTSRQQQSIQVI